MSYVLIKQTPVTSSPSFTQYCQLLVCPWPVSSSCPPQKWSLPWVLCFPLKYFLNNHAKHHLQSSQLTLLRIFLVTPHGIIFGASAIYFEHLTYKDLIFQNNKELTTLTIIYSVFILCQALFYAPWVYSFLSPHYIPESVLQLGNGDLARWVTLHCYMTPPEPACE